MIEARNISKIYPRQDGDIYALDDVSLNLAPGEFVAVQGPSGCGKTTLLLAIETLLKPNEGKIEIDGKDIYAISPEKRAKFRAEAIGFVFQQFHLIPYFTVRDNILAPTIALPSKKQSKVDDLMEHFNLSNRKDHFPADLSTGERQRTALARALINNPKLLLADEPTGNLDTANAEIVLGYMKEFAGQGGSVLLVTHDVRAAECADRTLAMKNGRFCK